MKPVELSFSDRETEAFVSYINQALGGYPELSHKLPIEPDSGSLVEAINDGVLLW